MATTHSVQKLLALAGKFVVAQKGKWNHAQWEVLLKEAGKLGVGLNDEAKRNLGNILEAANHFYKTAPKSASKKKAVAKRKAKPKAKKKSK